MATESGPRQKVLKSLALVLKSLVPVLKSLVRKPRPPTDLLSMPPAPPALSLSIALTMALVPQSLAPVLKSLVRKPSR